MTSQLRAANRSTRAPGLQFDAGVSVYFRGEKETHIYHSGPR